MRKHLLLLLSVLLSFSLVAAACGDDDEGSDVSVGLVFDIGGEGDQSFNDSAAARGDVKTEKVEVSAANPLFILPQKANEDE